jgi:L-threonylcarbamoyladenylate synthase
VAMVLDGGDCAVGLESTIVACLDGRVTLLRPGSISRSQVADVVGRVDDPGADAPRVPGRERSHYAPGTPLAVVAAGDLRPAVEDALAAGLRVAVLARSEPMTGPGLTWRRMPAAAPAYGHALYAALRALDAAGADRILAEAVPAGEEWAAVADRLARAAVSGP